MPRPPVERKLGFAIAARGFRPADALDAADPISDVSGDEIVLSFDEAEALRLADLDGLYQQAAAQRMGVSRQTFGRIVESARKKTADALLNGKALRIDGGTVSIASHAPMASVIAVPTNDENAVEEHFGLCSSFAIFSAGSDGKIVSERRFDLQQATGCRSGLIPALAAEGVTHLIVGRIGEGALRVLGSHGMAVFRGATGPVREVAEACLRGELDDGGYPSDIDASMGPGPSAARRGKGHGRGGHGCGEGGRGCADRSEK